MLSARSYRKLQRGLPGWLALFAMTMQLVVSFGHLHPEDYRFLLRGHGAPTLTAGDFKPGSTSPTLPVDDACPICASVFLLGNAPMPATATLPMPHGAALAASPSGEALWLSPPHYFLFVTRAPPRV